MSFTDLGYQVRRFPEILEQIRLDLENRLGTSISSNPDTIISIINNIYSDQIATLENNIQSLSENLDVYKATGFYLDRIVRYLGLSRLQSQPASGLLKITRDSSQRIGQSVRFSNVDGVSFISPFIETSLTSCNSVELKPLTVLEDVPFSISVNGNNFNIVASAVDDTNSIVNFFVTEINNTLGYITENKEGVLFIGVPDIDQNGLSFPSVGNFELEKISSYNEAQSVLEGFLQVPENTVTILDSSQSSILEVNNPFPFVSGRDVETDEELRARFEKSKASGGTSTYDNILASLLELPNVVDAFIVENKGTVEDPVTGLPAKSYQCIVVDGNESNIADTIWKTKPVGVETFGPISSSVLDIKNRPHIVKWGRPETYYMFVEATYTKYNEELFPDDGQSLIQDAIMSYGQTLGLDNDIIPERFIGGIYRVVEGIDSLSIRIGFSTDSNDSSPSSGFTSNRIPISFTQIPLFTRGRITLIEG